MCRTDSELSHDRDWTTLGKGVVDAFASAGYEPDSWLDQLKIIESGALLEDFLAAIVNNNVDARLMVKLSRHGRVAVFGNQVR